MQNQNVQKLLSKKHQCCPIKTEADTKRDTNRDEPWILFVLWYLDQTVYGCLQKIGEGKEGGKAQSFSEIAVGVL